MRLGTLTRPAMFFDTSVAPEVEDFSDRPFHGILGKASLAKEPRYYRVVLGTLFVKPHEDPHSEKILKVNLSPGTTVTTTGQLWRGRHGNVWAELDPGRYKDWRWACVMGPGFGIGSPLLAAEEEYGLIIGAPRRRIPKKKKKPDEDEQVDEEPPDDELPQDFQTAEPTGSSVHFQIEASSIAIRTAPCTKAPSLGGLGKGKILFGKPYSFSGNPWLRIDADECKKLYLGGTMDGWVLIHGSCIGMGQLLRKLTEDEETEQLNIRKAAAAAALEDERKALAKARQEVEAVAAGLPDGGAEVPPGPAEAAASGTGNEGAIPADERTVAYFEVVHESVAVRAEPSMQAASLSTLSRGKILSGMVRTVDSGSWLCLGEGECKRLLIKAAQGWVLVLDVASSLGVMLRMLNKEEERTYLHAQGEIEKERAHMEAVKKEAEEQRLALQREKAEFEARKKAAEELTAAAALAAARPPDSPAHTPTAGVAPVSPAGAPAQPAQQAAAAAAGAQAFAGPPAPKVVRPPGEVKSWGVEEVITFLESLELGKYAETFRENGIDGEYLLDLSEADLIGEIGLPKLSARKIMKKMAA